MSKKTLDYARIAQAIGYIRENFKRQPGLDEIAGEVALSTAHFQRMFTEWAGVSPKKFLQYTSIEYAKRILNETHASFRYGQIVRLVCKYRRDDAGRI